MTTVSHRLVSEDSGVRHNEASSTVLSTLMAYLLGVSPSVPAGLTVSLPEVVQLLPVDPPNRIEETFREALSLVAALRLATCRTMRNGPIAYLSLWLDNRSWRTPAKSDVGTNLSLVEDWPEDSLVDWVARKR